MNRACSTPAEPDPALGADPGREGLAAAAARGGPAGVVLAAGLLPRQADLAGPRARLRHGPRAGARGGARRRAGRRGGWGSDAAACSGSTWSTSTCRDRRAAARRWRSPRRGPKQLHRARLQVRLLLQRLLGHPDGRRRATQQLRSGRRRTTSGSPSGTGATPCARLHLATRVVAAPAGAPVPRRPHRAARRRRGQHRQQLPVGRPGHPCRARPGPALRGAHRLPSSTARSTAVTAAPGCAPPSACSSRAGLLRRRTCTAATARARRRRSRASSAARPAARDRRPDPRAPGRRCWPSDGRKPLLKVGSGGNAVRRLQRALNASTDARAPGGRRLRQARPGAGAGVPAEGAPPRTGVVTGTAPGASLRTGASSGRCRGRGRTSARCSAASGWASRSTAAPARADPDASERLARRRRRTGVSACDPRRSGQISLFL